MKRKNPALYPFTPFEGRLSRDEVWQAVFPPWENLTHPLVRYEIRQTRRRGTRPWLGITVTIITLSAMIAVVLIGGRSWKALWVTMLAGLLAYLVLGRLRLLVALAEQATRMITLRRERGDWDLIMLTPIPKSRWVNLQVTALIWQTWPLVRGLMIIHAVFMLLAIGYLGVAQHDSYQNEAFSDSYQYLPDPDAHYLPAWIFVALALPIGALATLIPLAEVGLYASAVLNASAESRMAAFSLLRAVIYLGIGRIVSTVVFVVVTPLAMMVLIVILGTLFPQEFNGMDVRLAVGLASGFIMVGTLLAYGIPVVFLAFMWEWLPWIGILALTMEMPYLVHVVIFLAFLLTLPYSYTYAPIESTRGFLTSALHRLSRRD